MYLWKLCVGTQVNVVVVVYVCSQAVCYQQTNDNSEATKRCYSLKLTEIFVL